MRYRSSLMVLAAALVLSTSAEAAVVKLRGTYFASFSKRCPVVLQETLGGDNFVRGLLIGNPNVADISETMGTATITATTITLSTTEVLGSAIRISRPGQSTSGTPLSTKTETSTAAYSTIFAPPSGSKLVIDGQTFTAVYQYINKTNRVARRVEFVGIDSDGCAIRGYFNNG